MSGKGVLWGFASTAAALVAAGTAARAADIGDVNIPIREALPRAEDAYRKPGTGAFGGQDAWQTLRRLEDQLKAQQQTIADQQKALADQRRELEAMRVEIENRDGARPASRNGAAGRNGQARTVRAADRRLQGAQVPVPPGTDDAPQPPQPLEEQPVPPGPVPPGPVAPGPVAPGPVAPSPQPPGPVTGPAPPAAPTTPPEGRAGTEEEREAADQRQREQLLEAGAILLPPGRLQIESTTDYTHASSNRINIGGFTIFEAILIGTIRVDDLKRDIITDSVAARLGLFRRLQVEATIPYIYRFDHEILGPGTNDQRTRDISGTGIGDASATVTYQPIIAHGIWPNLLTRLRIKMPTGTNPFEIPTVTNTTTGETRLKEAATGAGFYAYNAGMTAVFRSDPAVFFVSTGYTYNVAHTYSGVEYDPGDTLDYSIGLNVALSDKVAINLGFSESFTFETKTNGKASAGSSANDARLSLGTSIGITPTFSLLFTAAVGLTRDSPDFAISFSVPYTFDLF